MATKIVDLSLTINPGEAMWPRLVGDNPGGSRSFIGIRSTGWGGTNHPGWYDFGQPFPYSRGLAGAFRYFGHLHAATHIDAPKYAIPDGITGEKIPLENLYGTGVVLDMRHKGKWDKIEATDLEKATPKIEDNDFVVINTGWQKQKLPDREYEWFHYYPGLMPSAAEWLIKKKVKAIAGTWPTCDHSLNFAGPPLGHVMPNLAQDYLTAMGKPVPGEFAYGYEACLTMLLKAGVSCIQGAGGDIDEVTGMRCTLCAFPFHFEDSDAILVRLVAILEDK